MSIHPIAKLTGMKYHSKELIQTILTFCYLSVSSTEPEYMIIQHYQTQIELTTAKTDTLIIPCMCLLKKIKWCYIEALNLMSIFRWLNFISAISYLIRLHNINLYACAPILSIMLSSNITLLSWLHSIGIDHPFSVHIWSVISDFNVSSQTIVFWCFL